MDDGFSLVIWIESFQNVKELFAGVMSLASLRIHDNVLLAFSVNLTFSYIDMFIELIAELLGFSRRDCDRLD